MIVTIHLRMVQDHFKRKYDYIYHVCRIAEIVQLIFHLCVHACVFCSSHKVEMLQKTSSPVFISLLDVCVFYQHSTFGSVVNTEDREKEASSFPFLP